MNNNDIANLNEKLSRIKDATDSIRNTLGMTTSDVIENVASGVSTLNIEKEELEDELEHAEERVLNEYFNINLDNTTNWREMQKQAIPYQANGLSELDSYFLQYPFEEIHISGIFGKPQNLNLTFQQCQAQVIDIPTIDTSEVVDFTQCFYLFNDNHNGSGNSSVIQNIIDNWDTSKGRDFNSMFSNTYNVQGDLDLSHFDMSSAENIGGMLSNSNMHISGYEHWDVSKVNTFDYLFQSRSGNLDWTLDLTDWHNNKDNYLSFYGTFGWNYSRPQKILIPNIKNDYRDGGNMTDAFAYDYHLLFIDISGFDFTRPIDGAYAMFPGLSPWCVLIVKDDNSKQELLNYYPDFKQIYTKAEYNNNDDLYTIFNFYITDKEGNDLANKNAHFIIQYKDENEDWQDCWSNNGNQLYYPEEGYGVILPRNGIYRFQADFEGYASDWLEYSADQTQIDINMVCGPELATVRFDLLDDAGQPLSEPMDITIYRPNGETEAITYEGETITLSGYEGLYVDVEYGGGIYTLQRRTLYFHNQYEELYMGYATVEFRGRIYWDNGEISNTEPKELRYYWVDYNTGEDLGQGSGWTITLGDVAWGTNMKIKDLVEHRYKLGFTCWYDGVEYYNHVFDETDIDESDHFVHIDNIILPTPEYATVRAHVIDTTTSELLDVTKITQLAIIQNGNYFADTTGENEFEYPCKVGSNVWGRIETTLDYTETNAPPVTIQKDIINDIYVYASPAASFTLNVYDETGSSLPADHDIIYRLYSYDDLGQQMETIVDIWGRTPSHTCNYAISWLENASYVKACVLGYEGNYDVSWSDDIPLTSSTTYTIPITVRNDEPESENAHVTVEFDQAPNSVGFYDENTGFEYEYGKSTAQTFELEVPIGITLNTQATCDGFESINEYTSIDGDIVITLQFEPEEGPYVDVTINVYDNKTNDLVTGDVNISLDNSDTGDHYNFTGNGRTWSVIAGHYTVDVTAPEYMNYRGYFTWLENRVASVRMDSTAAGMAHVTFEFDQPVDLISLYNGRTGLDYEYEQTTAQTFELEVPIGILLNMSASSSGFYSVDDSINVDGDKTLSYHFEPEEEPWFDPEWM